MIERIILVLILSAIAVAGWRLFARRRLRQAAKAAPNDSLLNSFRPGVPAIVCFTTPQCAPCKTQQAPALKRIEAEMGDQIQIFRVDATEDVAAAERWGVFSAPTTFVLDGAGQPREVNYGVADADKLRRQLQALAAPIPYRSKS